VTAPRIDSGGTYTLVAELPEAATISVGALDECRFPAGAYAYTGSALGSGGFSRVHRHRRTAAGTHDVRHWHIDYLLGHPAVTIDQVIHGPGVDVECAVATRLPEGPVERFGASDCDCRSHLSRAATLDDLTAQVVRAYAAAGSGRPIRSDSGGSPPTDQTS